MSSDGSSASSMREDPSADGIGEEIDRQSRLVPYIGHSWRRWYDYPYRLLEVALRRRRWWRLLPDGLRHRVLAIETFLSLFNSRDRERIAWLGNPLHRIVVPDDELIETPVIWAVEYFTPAYARRFERSLASRAWPRDRFGRVPGDELHKQVQRMREKDRGYSGPVATFVDRGSKRGGFFNARRERLPPPFEWIEVRMEALGPALTALVATFHLTLEAQRRLDRAVKARHDPRIVRVGRAFHLYQPLFQGINEVQGERARLHAEARRWLSAKAPGMFCKENGGRLPVLDLLLTHKYDPLAELPDRQSSNYARAVGLERTQWEEVTSPSLPGFRLEEYHPGRLRQDDHAQWTLAAHYDHAFVDKDLEMYGGARSATTIGHAADDLGSALATRLAIFEFIDLKQRQLSANRDLASAIHAGGRPAASLKQLRRSVLTQSLDLESVASDIVRLAKNRYRYEWNVPQLTLSPGAWQRERERPLAQADPALLAAWAKRQRSELKALLKADRALVERLQIVSTLTSALSAVRSQRWAIVVSVASLGAALAAVWYAYLALLR